MTNPATDFAIGKIKFSAGEHILRYLPDWKQRNLLARSSHLSMIRESRPNTEEEAAEMAHLLACWNWVGSVRQASNVAQESLQSLTLEELRNYEPPRWPEWPF